MERKPKIALTIAGMDASGGVGIAADLKIFMEYGVYSLATLFAIVTMNIKQNWKHEVSLMEEKIVEKQLSTAFAGLLIDAVKTRMLANEPIIHLTTHHLAVHQQKNIVIDPVVACKGEKRAVDRRKISAF